MVAHKTCFNILQNLFREKPVMKERDHVVRLCEIDKVLGRCSGTSKIGRGRFPSVDYEKISGPDLRPYWGKERDGDSVFDWQKFNRSNVPRWVLARLDVFPRFFPSVSEKRINSVGEPVEMEDKINALPLVVFRVLTRAMDAPTYVMFMSSCRSLRRLALTTFQSRALELVVSLPWSMPLLHAFGSPEYDSTLKGMAHPSKVDGDWLLY